MLPGSPNAIAGQGAVIKLRPTAERSPTSMLLENPYEANTTIYDSRVAFRYRQMKYVQGLIARSLLRALLNSDINNMHRHACGENPGIPLFDRTWYLAAKMQE